MNIPDKAMIWRDSLALSTFHVGLTSRLNAFSYFSLSRHAILDCFGLKACARAEGLVPSQPTPLKDVLDAPDTDTPKRRNVPLTDAELLTKLPAFITTVSGKKLTEKQLYFLMEELRWK